MTEETKQEAPMVPPPLPSEYYAMVVDSGPIIKQDVRNLMGKAQSYITTPSVWAEIRDSKTRDYLEHTVIPLLDLTTREPSDRAMQDVIAFAKQTGDYASLSTVDLQVLALTLDLEREGSLVNGNTDLSHVRTTPKRKIGLGSIKPMNAKSIEEEKSSEAPPATPAAQNTAVESANPQESTDAEEEKQSKDTPVSENVPSEEAHVLLDYDEVEESDGEDSATEEEQQQASVELTAKLSEMRLKMASNFKSNLMKFNPKKNQEVEASPGKQKMTVNLTQMKQRMSENTAKIAENTSKMRESLSSKNLAENAAKMRESLSPQALAENTTKIRENIVSKVQTTKESLLKLNAKNQDDEQDSESKPKLPMNLNEMKQLMSENTNQMKQRMAENTTKMKNTLESTVTATRESFLNIGNKKNTDVSTGDVVVEAKETVAKTEDEVPPNTETEVEEVAEQSSTAVEEAETSSTPEPIATHPLPSNPEPPAKKSWATLVNPTTASTIPFEDAIPAVPFAKISLKSNGDDGGQFDDASEDEDETQDDAVIEEELQQAFPSLLAASTVPYEGEDDEIAAEASQDGENTNDVDRNPHHKARASVFMTEEEKQQNLKPLSKSGRTYNSFGKYKKLMKPKKIRKKSEAFEEDEDAPQLIVDENATNNNSSEHQGSRFLSGGGGGETMLEEDDDGVGWITSSEDIKFMKNEAGGVLDPGKTGPNNNNNNGQQKKASGPHVSQRVACATTDFAMQNVLLQMNLILLSSEGMRIRRLKTWVMRCGACFKIHMPDEDFQDGSNHHMKRLFCKHCGSDMMQRISASVDGKTGRLKLHFSKRKQGRHHSIRGTKFALPKPGSNNKYKGDLLLREDQLLSGAWNQKVKINSGRKYQTQKSQSMFGRDIASSVGCNVKSTSSATFGGKGWASSSNTTSSGFGTNSDDIRVGFGARKNPNAARGRERRGKKKKSSDRACGMRRY
eukprot:CAMPEP_0116105418 /NCGR_PEP_ID=MMETSP0327-20121206/15022_1 /TAXON_ID=44447 /ORGANISM="Pseudo-nitzschia delicatissima, Strain B596" /LENGTH=961 /DNA_ID=CAMNT_0003597823 /DNA_START=37 /DNA_END=2922 /DNA_ORIENTATION=-